MRASLATVANAAVGPKSSGFWRLALLIGTVCVLSLLVVGPALVHPSLGAVDDHEIILLPRQIQADGFLKTLGSYVFEPDARFRPMYWVVRFTEVSVWGTNPFGWYIDRLALAVLTVLLGYWAFLSIAPRSVALLAAALVLIGPQSESWYRLGPQEAIGTPLILGAIALAFRDRPRGGLLLGVLAALTKESFAPGLFLLIALCWMRGHRRAALLALVPAVAIMAAIIHLEASRTDLYLLPRTPSDVLQTAGWMVRFGLWPVAMLVPNRRLGVLAVAGAALGSQAFIYAGIVQPRYLLPWVVFSAGLFAFGAGYLVRIRPIIGNFVLVAALGIVLAMIPQTTMNSKAWAASAAAFQSFISRVQKVRSTHPALPLVVTYRGLPYEEIVAVRRYVPEGRAMLYPAAPLPQSRLNDVLQRRLQNISRYGDPSLGYEAWQPTNSCLEVALSGQKTRCSFAILLSSP